MNSTNGDHGACSAWQSMVRFAVVELSMIQVLSRCCGEEHRQPSPAEGFCDCGACQDFSGPKLSGVEICQDRFSVVNSLEFPGRSAFPTAIDYIL